jgi:hypothetical protein
LKRIIPINNNDFCSTKFLSSSWSFFYKKKKDIRKNYFSISRFLLLGVCWREINILEAASTFTFKNVYKNAERIINILLSFLKIELYRQKPSSSSSSWAWTWSSLNIAAVHGKYLFFSFIKLNGGIYRNVRACVRESVAWDIQYCSGKYVLLARGTSGFYNHLFIILN